MGCIFAEMFSHEPGRMLFSGACAGPHDLARAGGKEIMDDIFEVMF